MNKETQQSGAGVETVGVEVDVSEWTLEDWLKDHKEAPEHGSYKTDEGWWRRSTSTRSMLARLQFWATWRPRYTPST